MGAVSLGVSRMIEIRILGPTMVQTSEALLCADRLGGAKPRHILQILALAGGAPVSKERLADLLWEGHPPRAYLATLESYVCVLRRTVGLGSGRSGALSTVPHGYVLDPEAVVVDVTEFRRRAQGAQRVVGPVRALAELTSALSLVLGELLAGEDYAGWVTAERDAFRLELASVCTRAAELALEIGRPEVAVDLARRAVAADPLDENGFRMLMTALWRSGRRPEALRAYADLRRHLADELGTDPSRDIAALFVAILRAQDGDTELDARAEVKLLFGLLRQAVASIPGTRVPPDAHGLARMAAEVAAAS